ncbi:protein CLMP1 [Magnolia sinica]|uniref:protein CLMP1 n=1 Tax=Magnolia sinica TaxID=86752 RepID=UPI002658481F|nr:protein CLMP1 [Magnolia sinica]XP_058081454.1 protein CLMP1 [Magnolia sinica]XP_058081455.1 protein CLMP1 [Magnolia sinica]XP_058081456.1 protein CLMP1 [Magnolia sinica]XP_058081457.1 protein CLMP1 [Magnolia sinica]
MGKSGGRRKKGGNNPPTSGDAVVSHSAPPHATAAVAAAANGVDLDSSIFLKRAHELKEEGNRRFQSKDYAGALQQYDLALQHTPKTHPDRAIFHSNRAACLMQMKPVDYNMVVAECSLALQVQPRFGRALLRRARAFEALSRYDMAMQDVQALLTADPNHRDALEIARRLRVALGPRQEAQQDLQSQPSPAALGASAVRGAPIGGLGPCLPARTAPKKAVASNKHDKPLSPTKTQQPISPSNGPELKSMPRAVLKPFKGTSEPLAFPDKDNKDLPLQSSSSSLPLRPLRAPSVPVVTQWRPLKLIYDHDIRLAQMPANCSFRVLRDIVANRYPSSKSVLVKYKDMDGDLVTITSTDELRLAESCIDGLAPKEKNEASEMNKSDALAVLRLHVVEVSPDQEPPLVEEEEKPVQEPSVEDEVIKGDQSVTHSSTGDSVLEGMDNEAIKTGLEEDAPAEKTGGEANHTECKEVEIDDWLFEFAQLFRTQVGIDPDAHIDLHELGMELCSEALEETVTSEEAQSLFDMAASKFQEVAALAFFNWGNVHMCAARKRIPLDELAPKEVMTAQLEAAYDWVQERYSLAGQKYEEALRIKPDFYEGLLALGQQHFETAKLRWSFALANKVNLETWDSTETIGLFDSAEMKMKAATEMWEKLEEQRANELKDPSVSRKDELLKRRKKHGTGTDGQPSGNGQGELSAEEAAEQAAVMRSQIHLFWGNMLFERSQVEFKLGLEGWEKNLDAAVERFKLAGASEADIAVVLKNHSSNGGAGVEGDGKNITSGSTEITETNGKAEVKHVPER